MPQPLQLTVANHRRVIKLHEAAHDVIANVGGYTDTLQLRTLALAAREVLAMPIMIAVLPETQVMDADFEGLYQEAAEADEKEKDEAIYDIFDRSDWPPERK
jgi:hypothetical protein